MKKTPAAESPDAYVEALAGWRRTLVEALRASALGGGKVEERIKWGHPVYFSNGPVLLIRAEPKRVLFGFWRGKRLQDIDARLKPGGKYEMATMALGEGDEISAATANRLVRAAVGLNRKLGDPTAIKAMTTRTRKPPRCRAAHDPEASAPGSRALREIVLQLPDVEDASTERGIAFKARGKLLACAAIHASAEPNSLVVRISHTERPRLMAAYAQALYLTNHYAKHPAVLARIDRLDRDAWRDILGAAWLFVTEKAVGTKRGTPRRKR
jgi:hypothetical protein